MATTEEKVQGLANGLGNTNRKVQGIAGALANTNFTVGDHTERISALETLEKGQPNSAALAAGASTAGPEVDQYGHQPGAVIETVQHVVHRFHVPDDRVVEHTVGEGEIPQQQRRSRLVHPPRFAADLTPEERDDYRELRGFCRIEEIAKPMGDGFDRLEKEMTHGFSAVTEAVNNLSAKLGPQRPER